MEEFYLKKVLELLDSDDDANIQLAIEIINGNEDIFEAVIRWLFEDSFDVDALLRFYRFFHLKIGYLLNDVNGMRLLYMNDEDRSVQYILLKNLSIGRWYLGRGFDDIGFNKVHQKCCKYEMRQY